MGKFKDQLQHLTQTSSYSNSSQVVTDLYKIKSEIKALKEKVLEGELKETFIQLNSPY